MPSRTRLPKLSFSGNNYEFATHRFGIIYEGTSRRGYLCAEIVEKSSTASSDTYRVHVRVDPRKEIRFNLEISKNLITANDFLSVRRYSQIKKLPAEATLSIQESVPKPDVAVVFSFDQNGQTPISGSGTVLSVSSELSLADAILKDVMKMKLSGGEPAFEMALYLASGLGQVKMDLNFEDEVMFFRLDSASR